MTLPLLEVSFEVSLNQQEPNVMKKGGLTHIRTRLRMSNSHTGLTQSEETKAKISNSRRIQESEKRKALEELNYLKSLND